jgi:hypothetical protein
LKGLLIGIVTEVALNSFLMTRTHLLLHVWSLLLFANHLFVILKQLVSLFFVSSIGLWIVVQVATGLTPALSSIIVAELIIGDDGCNSIGKLLRLRDIGVMIDTRPCISSRSVDSCDFSSDIIYNGHHSCLGLGGYHISFRLVKLLLLLHQYIVELLSVIGDLSVMR